MKALLTSIAVACFAVAFCAAVDRPAWDAMTPEQSATTRVGFPVPGKCCLWAVYSGCSAFINAQCAKPPIVCTAEDSYDDECANAVCKDSPLDSCTTPAKNYTAMYFSCTLTGLSSQGPCPNGKERCEFDVVQKNITYISCNNFSTYCTPQPANVCD